MKVAFIGGKSIGGIASYVTNLAQEIAKKGVASVIYFDGEENSVRFLSENQKIICKKPRGGGFFRKPYLACWGIWDALKHQKNIDVFHFSNGLFLPLFVWVIKVISPQSKIVIHVHSFAWMSPKYGKGAKKIIEFLEWFSLMPFHHFVVVSSAQQEILKNRYGKKSVVVPSAINPPAERTQSLVLKDFGLTSQSYYLFLGRLDRIKNIDVLIKAYLASGIKEKQLVIAGSNDEDPLYVEELHHLASENKQIIFTGAVFGESKEALLANCHAFCIISSSEGMPISLLEAMSHGRYCITSDIAGNREAIGMESLWVKPGDVESLQQALLQSEHKTMEMMLQEVRHKERALSFFTWERISGIYQDYLNRLINKR